MPDRTGHTHEVLQATRRPDFTVEVDGKEYPFGRDYAFRVKDEAVANEIRNKYGREVVVQKIRMPRPEDIGHNFFFGGWPEMPWKRKEE